MGMKLLLLLVVVCAAVVAVAGTEEYGSGCADQAHKATASCTAQLGVATAKAKKACGGRSYKDVLGRVKRLKRMAAEQEKALKRGEKALSLVRGNAARIAKMSGKERAALLAQLSKQKGGKNKVNKAERREREEQAKAKHLRGQADRAMAKAVRVAKSTGDKSKITSAKAKAHTLYTKMVNEKVRIASVHHYVTSAKKALGKISKAVEKEIGIAKETAKREAQALRDVAKARENVAHHKKKEAQLEVSAASTAEHAAASAESKVIHKVHRVQGEIVSGKREVKRAKGVVAQSKKAAKHVGKAKVSVGSLKMSVLKKEAAQYAKTGHFASHHHHEVHRPKRSVHTKYANKVKELERQRLGAKRRYHEAEARLTRLKQSHAGAHAITQAQAEANNAAASLRRVVNAQKEAVAKAVQAVQATTGHP